MQRHSIAALGLGIAALMLARPCFPQVTVVNVVPALNSGESDGNPEPNLAIKDASLKSLVVTAHLPGKGLCVDRTLNGLFASTDGGFTWTLVCADRPTAPTTTKPGDITTRFSSTGDRLFISSLLGGTSSLVASPDMMSGASFVNALAANPAVGNVDQPQLRTLPAPMGRVAIAEVDDGYVDEDGNTVQDCYQSRFLWATLPTPVTLKSFCTALRQRTERPWANRVAVSDTGVTYVALLEVKTDTDGITKGDVVVLRGTPFNTASPRLDAIKETGTPTSDICAASDGQIGVRVATCVPVAWDASLNPSFGYEVRRGSLAIAVHPTQPMTVYVAWADSGAPGRMQTVHVRKSTDGGQTWPGPELFTIANATNPSLAVSADGRLGFLSQELAGTSTSPRWHTRLRLLPTVGEPQDILLANTPAVDPSPDKTTPYQGDYTDVVAVGSTFLGVFSARNDPASSLFPYGVRYNRYCSGGQLRKTASTTAAGVKPSVDPFFFRVGPGTIGQPGSGSGLTC